jgi:hypothetical protein
MDFQSLIFDVYFLSQKIQTFSNEISGLEFADERGHLDSLEVNGLRRFEDLLAKTKKIAESRLEAIREQNRDGFIRHLDEVLERISTTRDTLKKKNDPKLHFDIAMLEDLMVHVRDIRQGGEPKYSVWWVFFYITTVLGQSIGLRFTGKGLGDANNRLSPCCPACSAPNDITNSIDIFLPPTGAPYASVTILDEYACATCHQRFRVMFKINFRDAVKFEIISIDFPEVSFTW